MVKDIRIDAFDYELPDDKIPKHPLEKRDECKLLVREPSGKIEHKRFRDLPELIPSDSLLVCNDTKVINARILFHKETGAAIELFLLEPVEPSDYALNFQSQRGCVWKCLVGNSKKWKDSVLTKVVEIGKYKWNLYADRIDQNEDGTSDIKFTWNNPNLTFATLVDHAGRIPIPPYLNRDSEDSDLEDYQTVYAKYEGSVAAPTAGLHFTPKLFDELKKRGVTLGKVTLHVGSGTFRPVKSDTIGEHPMHGEPFTVSREMVERLIKWKREKKPVIAVGTTTVRTLESLPYIGRALGKHSGNPFNVTQWEPYNGEDFDTVEALKNILIKMKQKNVSFITASTSIMIAPEFKWRITDGIITNFHQPKSTLLLLVSSFLGGEKWKEVYEKALNNDYRFLSYGDASLLFASK